MKGSKRGKLPASSLAALARTAADASWPGVLLLGAGSALLRRLPAARPRWLQAVQALWSAFFLSRALAWAGESWPDVQNGPWIGLILLLLACWLVRKGRGAVDAASGMLGILELGLLAAVLLGSLREIRPENLLPRRGWPDGWLLAVLLLPGEGCGAPWALPFSLAAADVGSGGENSFLTMSRSVSGIGSLRRLESLASSGMTLGIFLLAAELLSRENAGDRAWSAALAAGLYCSGFRLNGWAAALCAAVVWCFLPALCYGKTKIKDETVNNDVQFCEEGKRKKEK